MSLALTLAAALAAPTFSGDAPTDFAITGAESYPDPAGIDVGVPNALPAGSVSGWDIDSVELFYDRAGDTMYVGVNTFGILGDADGDGDPSVTSPELAGLGGFDLPNLGPLESVAFYIDIDEDGVFDAISGVPATTDLVGFGTYTFVGTPFAPGFAFGVLSPSLTGAVFGNPVASAPDFEMTIPAFSTITPSSGFDAAGTFGWAVFAGSFSDAGVGEDFYPGAGEMETSEIPYCGDGVLHDGESCDDGNRMDGDGCDAACQLEQPDDFGCTYTIGWYKTHNPLARQSSLRVDWPLPHTSMLCGRTWLDWLNASPRGDKWIILAHQWIGATLNAQDASTPDAVSSAMGDAAMILADCRVSCDEADEAGILTTLLDSYNNGLIGPGHCDETPTTSGSCGGGGGHSSGGSSGWGGSSGGWGHGGRGWR